MDSTDIVLIQLLLMNSRTPYRELAEKLGLSVNAVHKRVNYLMEIGLIQAFTAKVRHMALDMDYVPVLVWGNTTSNAIDETMGVIRMLTVLSVAAMVVAPSNGSLAGAVRCLIRYESTPGPLVVIILPTPAARIAFTMSRPMKGATPRIIACQAPRSRTMASQVAPMA